MTEVRSRLKKAFRFFKPYISPVEPLLDIGTRDGWMLDYLRRKKFKDLQGIDITEEAVKYAQSQGRNVIWGDAHDLSAFEESEFGTVLMIHSLEHCYDPYKAINNVHRILKPSGVLFVEVPLEEKVNPKVAHFCCFADVRSLSILVGEQDFDLLKHRTYSLGKAKHLMCVFEKRH